MKKNIQILRKKFEKYKIDGYVVPKNDEYFTEYSKINRLQIISNFSGSAGLAIILKKKNYLFTDGRYTIQSQMESGKNFEIVNFEKLINCSLFKNVKLGIDPKILTYQQIKKYFLRYNKIKFIEENLIDQIKREKINDTLPFFWLDKKIVGESSNSKLNKLTSYLRKNKSDFIFISAPENVAWILNIRGHDSKFSPTTNARLLIDKKGRLDLFTNLKKIPETDNIFDYKIFVHEEKEIEKFLSKISNRTVWLDNQSCSIYYKKVFEKKNKILLKMDPVYLMKAVKNKTEIKNIKKSHLIDGIALTKFILWLKENFKKKKITEISAQNKLESFRKKHISYKYPSFNTISGSGPNSAIIHYVASLKTNRTLKRGDLYLVDSGGQYSFGTTDVTRTISLDNKSKFAKNVFTRVLKGHIAVATTNIDKDNIGKKIDKRARKFLNKSNLDYAHGTGHGVGFFLNVHEGPQSISKVNNIKIREGMVLSNEPGFYKKNHFGIRIENLVYVKKINKKLVFENLTMVPIEKDLINFELLNIQEKNYLFKYHLDIYSKISKYLNINEKKWLADFIQHF